MGHSEPSQPLQLILPTLFVPDDQILRPFFFLAGPIKGGGNWQENACGFFLERKVAAAIATPRRWGSTHPLHMYRAKGIDDSFSGQCHLWRSHYLERAARWGCLVFWLPCESLAKPRDDGQPYARDTHSELNAWRARLKNNPSLRLVIGAERGFPGLKDFSRRLNADIGRRHPIHPTLNETLQAALQKATG